MRWWARLSISGKLLLVTLLISSVAILSGFGVLLVSHRTLVLDEMAGSVRALTLSTGENCVGPLVFEDRNGATDVLESLNANDRIRAAVLFDAEHRPFAVFQAAGQVPVQPRTFDSGVETRGDLLLVTEPVRHEGRTVGTLLVVASTARVAQRLSREMLLALGLSLCLIFACGVVGARLQRSITAPIVHLAGTMRGFMRTGDLDARVEPPSSDELGTLYKGFNAMLGDIQAREDERDRSEKQLRALLDALPDLVFVLDREGRFVELLVSDPGLAVAPPQDAVGKPVAEVLPVDIADALAAMARDTISTGERQHLEYSLDVPAGTRFFEAVSSPVLVRPTDPLVLIISRDVSERRDLERQLRHASKMDAIGRLAGGVAHDFNNLLGGILGFAELISRSTGEQRTKEFAGHILGACDRAAQLVRQLLTFSRRSEPDFRPTLVGPLMENVATILRRTIDPRITVRLDLEPSPTVRADAAHLEAAFLNLAVNARDAMPQGGELTLRVRPLEVTAADVGRHGATLVPGHYVEASVIDNGCGIEPSLQQRIFEPFFTTKPSGMGTGLGLAAVYGTVQSHGGVVSLESSLGKGSEFRILLPSLGTATEAASAGATPLATGEGRILVVDDEDYVREVAARSLRELGYTTTEAADGQQALDIVRRAGGAFDLVVLDMVMPRLSGAQVLDELRRRFPTLPVLLISGHAPGVQLDEARRKADGFLRKPFRHAELAVEVQRVLGKVRERAQQRTAASGHT